MPVLNDWKCIAHGVFESYVGKCPHGCGAGMVHIVHLKAPGAHTSGKTKFIDKKMRELAQDFGVTDMNNRNGTAAQDDFRWNQSSNQMLAGNPFSVPVKDVASFMSQVGAEGSGGMKQAGKMQGLKAIVEGSYNPKIKPEAA